MEGELKHNSFLKILESRNCSLSQTRYRRLTAAGDNDYAISLPFCTMANPLPLWAKSPAKGQSNGYPLLSHLLDIDALVRISAIHR